MKKLIRIFRQIVKHPLSRRNPISAAVRFARWQIASRFSPGRIALPFVANTFLLARTGMTTATGNYYYGLMEPNEMGFLLHMLRPGDLFLDVGANIGSYTVLSSAVVGAKTVSIEPIQDTFQSLKKNVLLNDIVERVDLNNIGLSNKPGVLRFTAGGDAINHVVRDGEVADSVEIPVLTVDAVMEGRTPALIKIDVEGFELKVLEGARETISRKEVCAIIAETNDLNAYYGASNESIVEFLYAFGFRKFAYDPVARKLEECETTSFNSIFIRDHEGVVERVKGAPRFKLVTGEI